MGKIYTVEIKNIYLDTSYCITSFGDDPRSVHKHVLFKVISRNEIIMSIHYNQQCVFDDEIGFISKK
jgi:hypothetical protein